MKKHLFLLLPFLFLPIMSSTATDSQVADRKAISFMGEEALGKTFTTSIVIIHLGKDRIMALDYNDLKAYRNINPTPSLAYLKNLSLIYMDFAPPDQPLVPLFAYFTSENPLEFTFEVIDFLEGDPVGRFISFEDPQQKEAKTVLSDIAAKQKAYKAKKRKFAATFQELNFTFPEQTRYTYYLSPTECAPKSPCEPLPTDFEELKPYASFKATKKEFTAFAVANNDSDPTPDVWKIVKSGQPENIINDALK